MWVRPRSGQGTVEWIALIGLISIVLGTLGTAVGMRVPGLALGRAVAERMVCAARLSHGCRSDPELVGPYGAEVSELVRANAPRITYERGMTALPVDFRRCRSPVCADADEPGRVSRSGRGVPAAAFTHVIDCRTPAAASAGGFRCDGTAAGRVYIQYWLYYANSATLRGVPLVGSKGFHLDDWESYQVRIDPDGAVSARASSHNSYNGSNGIGNWPSDLRWSPATRVAEAIGEHDRGGWIPSDGELFVSGGSHAGHASADSLQRDLTTLLAAFSTRGDRPRRGTVEERELDRRRFAVARRWEQALFPAGSRYTPRGSLRLIPIEPLTGRDGTYSFAISPPWRKRVYWDPEYDGTD